MSSKLRIKVDKVSHGTNESERVGNKKSWNPQSSHKARRQAEPKAQSGLLRFLIVIDHPSMYNGPIVRRTILWPVQTK